MRLLLPLFWMLPLSLAVSCTKAVPGSQAADPSHTGADTGGPGSTADTAPSDDTDERDSAPPASSDPPPAVVINELMAANRTTIEGPGGLPLDWVELLNTTDAPVDLAGWALTDDWREPHLAPLPDGLVLDAGERVLLWLDPEGATEGTLPLGLAREGEVLRLFDQRGEEADMLGYTDLSPDEAVARIPDGEGEPETMRFGTPGAPNARLVEQLFTQVPAGASWSYLDGGQVPEGGMDGLWTTAAFDDSGWSEGSAPLGYGDAQTTVIADGASETGRALTAFFRHELVVDTASGHALELLLELRADDGARVWLDGTEVARLGLPAGTIDEHTTANRTVSGDGELAYTSISLDPAVLTEGSHVLAVDLHQANATSSDMTFDLQLNTVELVAVEPSPRP